MTLTCQRGLLLVLGALATDLLVAETARADFGWPPPENLTTLQGLVRGVLVTLTVELAIVVYFCRRNRWSLPRFLVAGVVGNLVSLPCVWIVSTVGFFFLAFAGLAVFVLAECGAVVIEAVFYKWIGREPLRACLRLALVANVVTMVRGVVDQVAARNVALEWLKELDKNADLACNVRVAVPMYIDRLTGKTRLWARLGVRLAPLDAEYAVPPKLRPYKDKGPWQDAEAHQLAQAKYLIPVDDFAEFELAESTTLTREEFGALCDRCQTKEAIYTALTGRQ